MRSCRGLGLAIVLAGTALAASPARPSDRQVEAAGVSRAPNPPMALFAPGGLRPGQSGAAAQVRYDRAWLDGRPAAGGGAEWRCLATALYFEARGESVRGQFAVAEVILNRVADPAWPDTVCAVVNQSCQFSYTCDGRSDRIRDPAAFARAGKIAEAMLRGGAPRVLTQGATHFHTTSVRPHWSRKLPRLVQIGGHVFYANRRVN